MQLFSKRFESLSALNTFMLSYTLSTEWRYVRKAILF